MRVRLRDFIITEEDFIFSVASYDTREGIRSVLRYLPDENGGRSKEGRNFRKLDFEESYAVIKKYHQEYIKGFEVIVPEEDVKEILDPNRRLMELTSEEEKIFRIFGILNEAGISESKIGITGSFLCGLQNEFSDIDLIVYGNDWLLARDVIEKAKKSGEISRVTEELWHQIYEKRKAELPFEEFFVHEVRKGHRGVVDGTYFDLLYVRDWDEVDMAEFRRGEDLGYEKITARVTNIDFAFDSPAIYHVEHEYIDRVLSYTHTYVGQALVGEVIEARGRVEKVDKETRLIVGTTREAKGEWIKSVTLLEGV
ncbi:MAG: nucleotidyltransferase domain-containing protein [Halobacteriota archaeon]|nr:nucleotidyltransferase domain-containing protein [Halobacteriota archaeon]